MIPKMNVRPDQLSKNMLKVSTLLNILLHW